MSLPLMYAVHSSVTHECLEQISTKYHLVDKYRVVLLGPTMVIDHLPTSKVGFYLYYFEKPDRTLHLSQDIDKISRLNVMMKNFPKAMLGQASMSPYWLRMGVVPSFLVRGLAHDLGSDDYNLPIIDDSFDGSRSEGINSQNQKEDEEESESLVIVHDSYDDDIGEQTPNVTTILVTVFGSDDEGEGGLRPMVRCKRGRDSIAFAALVAVMSGGEGSSGRIVKRSRSLDPVTFCSFVDSLGVHWSST
ncbi:unnamed protein product [Lactuca saligna]|uniref:Uncharacterized protein n=1 Tax=Lactuca saligna TaxID=75948 RepID=A0AA35YIM5_LACSI|nr:unnamed protein product [Lactuca saligna]